MKKNCNHFLELARCLPIYIMHLYLANMTDKNSYRYVLSVCIMVLLTLKPVFPWSMATGLDRLHVRMNIHVASFSFSMGSLPVGVHACFTNWLHLILFAAILYKVQVSFLHPSTRLSVHLLLGLSLLFF